MSKQSQRNSKVYNTLGCFRVKIKVIDQQIQKNATTPLPLKLRILVVPLVVRSWFHYNATLIDQFIRLLITVNYLHFASLEELTVGHSVMNCAVGDR